MRVTTILFLFLGVTYGLVGSYSNTKDLSPMYKIRWNIVGDTIHLALEVNTTGWIGFAIGESTSGSMPGADFLTAHISNGVVNIADRYALEKAMPIEDDCSHWVLVGGEETPDGRTIVEVHRKLNTNDNQDRPIVAGPTRVLFAFGTSDTFSYHGSNRHLGVVFFIPDSSTPNNITGTSSVELRMNNYSVPVDRTVYGCQSFYLPVAADIADQHIIRIEPILDPATVARVHHFVLKRCAGNDSWTESYRNNPQMCMNEPCHEYVWAWAPGMEGLDLPAEAGYRMGWSEGAVQIMSLQVHYDNPNLETGLVDNSGVRLIYTSKLRQYDAGVLQLGDPLVSAPSIPAGVKSNHYEFNCPTNCTSQWNGDIHVFGDFLHMHQLGKQMYTTHWRGDQYLGVLNKVDFWSFDLQQTTKVNAVIQKGDRLNTHCFYDSSTQTTETLFSRGSADEMCIDFVFYYPLLSSGWCGYGRSYQPPHDEFTVCGLDKPFLDMKNPTVVDTVSYPIMFGSSYNGTCNTVTQILPSGSSTQILPSGSSTQILPEESSTIVLRAGVLILLAVLFL